jgi:hypothetical protein
MDLPLPNAGASSRLACICWYDPPGPGRRRKPEAESGGRSGQVGFVRRESNPAIKGPLPNWRSWVRSRESRLGSWFTPARSPRKWSDQWVRLLDFRCGGPLVSDAMREAVRPMGSFAQFPVRLFPLPGRSGQTGGFVCSISGAVGRCRPQSLHKIGQTRGFVRAVRRGGIGALGGERPGTM